MAQILDGAHVVKGFNTLFGSVQANPETLGTTLDALYATDDETARDEFAALATSLGFRPVQVVHKQRIRYVLNWESRDIEVTLDDVRGVGTFVELEICADAAAMEDAKLAIQRLAERLQLRDGERRSYLQLLLDSQAK